MLKKLSVFIVVALIAWVSTSAQDTTELILENGVNDYEGTRDTSLYSESSNSNGAGFHLFSGQTNQGADRRALLAFDLTDVPDGATITSVSLDLTVSRARRGGDVTISLHRVTSDWGEGDADAGGQEGTGATSPDGAATWNENFRNESSWENEGGDFLAEASAELIIARQEGETFSYSSEGLVADVQAWVDGEADNFGWIIIADGLARRFHSSNGDAAEGQKPRLVINFTN